MPKNGILHLENLLKLLKQEKDADFEEFRKMVLARPLIDRVNDGYAWYPLMVTQTGFTIGEKASITVERTAKRDEPHQFRAGQGVNLFTQQPHVDQPEQRGIVHFVSGNKMKITLDSRDVPDWISFGQLGVDLIFDDRSYQEMEKAVKAVLAAKGNRLAELRDIILGKKPPAAFPMDSTLALPSLNASQQAAVHAVLAMRDVAVVHGPPGTGKTTTLVQAIKQLCKLENTVLVCAPSNTAADVLTERLDAEGVNVVRIGNISRVDETVVRHTLEHLLNGHPEHKHLKKVKLQAAEARRQARRFVRSFGQEEREERRHLYEQAKDLEAWASQLETRLTDEILSNADAITCTLVGASHPVLQHYSFKTCIIDEAAQALEPACWIPILKSSRVVLAGDPLQLPPTVKSMEAQRGGLNKTMLEQCIAHFPEVHLLNVQYRMHRAIMGFSNDYFYGGALQAHETVENRRLLAIDSEQESTVATFFEPVCFIDTAGTGFEEKVPKEQGREGGQSKCNPDEALLLREHLLQLLAHFDGKPAPSIACISPYRAQVNQFHALLKDDPTIGPLLRSADPSDTPVVTIDTIDGFQGQERDVVYISLVRSNAKNEIGFLSDYRRMNVAMTRARKLLIVIGDSGTIGKNKFYDAFLQYCEKEGQYETAWMYMQ